VVEAVWGCADATEVALEAATKVLSAAKAEVEARMRVLVGDARAALATSPFDQDAKKMLEGVTSC
jgi:hypothetical protein